jgi:hypothetical protein
MYNDVKRITRYQTTEQGSKISLCKILKSIVVYLNFNLDAFTHPI